MALVHYSSIMPDDEHPITGDATMVTAPEHKKGDVVIPKFTLPGGEIVTVRAPSYVSMDKLLASYDMLTITVDDQCISICLEVNNQHTKNIMVYALSKDTFVVVLNFTVSHGRGYSLTVVCKRIATGFKPTRVYHDMCVSAVLQVQHMLICLFPGAHLKVYSLTAANHNSFALLWYANFAVPGDGIPELLISSDGNCQLSSSSLTCGAKTCEVRFNITGFGPSFEGKHTSGNKFPPGCYWRLFDDGPGNLRSGGVHISGPMRRTSCMQGKKRARTEEECLKEEMEATLRTLISTGSNTAPHKDAVNRLECIVSRLKKVGRS